MSPMILFFLKVLAPLLLPLLVLAVVVYRGRRRKPRNSYRIGRWFDQRWKQ